MALITAPSREVALALARTLVEERLAACVNLMPGVTSVYRWEGELAEDAEVLLVAKTTSARLPELTARVLELHPYDVPEVVSLAPREVEGTYLAWLIASCEAADREA